MPLEEGLGLFNNFILLCLNNFFYQFLLGSVEMFNRLILLCFFIPNMLIVIASSLWDLDLANLFDLLEKIEFNHLIVSVREVQVLVLLLGICVYKGFLFDNLTEFVNLYHLVLTVEKVWVGVLVILPIESHSVEACINWLLMLSIDQGVVEPVAIINISNHVKLSDI